jgi:3-dehydroquinate synthase
MHNFFVDNLSFNVNSEIDDNFWIQSHPSPYDVTFDKMPKINRNDFLIIDKNISDIYGITSSNMFLIDPTEDIKTPYKSLEICDFLLNRKFSKSDILHVIGGGVIQDLCAFTAKIYKRGIDWVYYPTTMLSQCDSCIGGKTALNYGDFKNQIALFSSPKKVVIDTNFLQSLPEKELYSGFGEVIKLFITGGDFFVDNFENFSLKDKIKSSLIIKKSIIEVDEFEQNIRKVLNYGHTFGHIIESMTNYEILHGEAVLLGIYIINRLFDNNQKIDKIVKKNVDIDKIVNLNPLEIYNRIVSDKKVFNNKIYFVNSPKPGISLFLPTDIDEKLEERVIEIFTY